MLDEFLNSLNLPTDDVYAYALSKTLTEVSSPATVGLYSSCENRIHRILGQMAGRYKHTVSQHLMTSVCRTALALHLLLKARSPLPLFKVYATIFTAGMAV